MLINNTLESVFDNFETHYIKQLYQLYPHISKIDIYCYTSEQYANLKDVPCLGDLSKDAFAFSHQIKEFDGVRNTFAAIVITPKVVKHIGLSIEEQMAAIAHEVGHIIHQYNTAIQGMGEQCKEIKADEVASKIGLSEPLISVLTKLLESDLYTDEQCALMRYRVTILNASHSKNI